MALTPTALKYASLCVLCVQNSLLAILMRLSRVGNFPRFNPATAVFVGEALKLATCFAVLFHEFNALKEPQRRKRMGESFRTIANVNELLRVSVPAMLYVVQNNLQYVAVSNLDAPTFQVMYQLKILTTAIFSVVLLRKTVLLTQWGAIVTLMMGVALVQLDEDSSNAAAATAKTGQSTTKGLLAVVAACVCSGFAGVYFEKILKGSGAKTTLWERNVQMCFLGLALSGGGLLYNDLESILSLGFFYGYRPVVWAAICMSAFGGLLTAVVVKYADNILKAFATSIAVVLSVIMSVFVFDKVPTGQFVIGAILVNGSVYAYGKAPEWRKDHLEPILPLAGGKDAKEFACPTTPTNGFALTANATYYGVGDAVREVTIDSANARVIEVVDQDGKQRYDTHWSKTRSGLVELQFGLSSKTLDSPDDTPELQLRRWTHFLSTWLDEFLVQCEQDPEFKAGATQNLSAMQAFVAFVSIGYAAIALWLGSMKLTRWQRRSVLVTYTAAGTVEAIFLLQAFGLVAIHIAYPSTLALTAVFFVAFNVTNALLVLESEEPDAASASAVPVPRIVEATPTRIVTSQLAPCC
ncbi:hypothetical protein PF007_g15285 [Phytophthora fragariae]|uniref:Uncharacterized protein n=1 Tax=Phytophthora fragariae TaxID=53985 RepID=A0A6A3RP68_9STRA|nr:hypothetical protein PF007_g15285 [Phytophthora fragariae]